MEIQVKTMDKDLDYLRQRSQEVDFNDQTYLEEINCLKAYCNRENSNTLALAAIQVGIPKRMIYIRNTNVDDLMNKEIDEARIIINPVMIRRVGHTKFWEACASCLDNMGLVTRPYKIELEYLNELGEKRVEEFVGFEATVLSHEYDHLNGILHIDKAEQILIMSAEERKIFRESHPYEILSKEDDFIEEEE